MNTFATFLKIRTRIVFSVFILFLFAVNISAQNAIITSGGNASGAGGSLSYTIGQIFYKVNVGTNGSISQGVQQPYEISVVTSIKGTENIQLGLAVYPNPVRDNLTLRFTGDVPLQCVAYMYDINGSLLLTKKIEGNVTSVSMEAFLPGSYFLKVIQGSNEVKTFKIIKH
jgi:hypothetical protein